MHILANALSIVALIFMLSAPIDGAPLTAGTITAAVEELADLASDKGWGDTLNVQVDAVYGCGSTTGHDGIDKFERFGLTRFGAQKIKAPLVEQAVANLECRISQIVDMGASSLLIAHILAAHVEATHYRDGHLTFDNGLGLLHHISDNRFCVSDKPLLARKP